MNWSDIGDTLKNLAGDALPFIGGLIGGPVGSSVGSIAAKALGVEDDPKAVAQALQNDPDALVKLKQAEMDHRVELAKLSNQAAIAEYKHQTATIQAVNETIQQEAVGKGWLQRNAHPMCVVISVLFLVAVYFILPLAKIPVPSVPSNAWMFLAAVLGIGTYHNGVARRRAVSGASGVEDKGLLDGLRK